MPMAGWKGSDQSRIDARGDDNHTPEAAPPATEGRRSQNQRRPAKSLAHPLNIGGVQSLGARLDLELHLLSLGERLESFHADGGEMHKDVLSPLLLDEAVSFGVIEPLHFPFGQCALPPTM